MEWKSQFTYNAGEGVLYRLGKPVTGPVMIWGKRTTAQAIVWHLTYGRWPEYLVCVDGNKKNLKIENWKERENVWKCKRSGWWIASYKGKRINYYGTESEARNAVEKARRVDAEITRNSP